MVLIFATEKRPSGSPRVLQLVLLEVRLARLVLREKRAGKPGCPAAVGQQ